MLLVRNGDWARDFFSTIASHATAEGLAEMRPAIEAELGPLQTGFFDTPIIVYLLKTQPKYLDGHDLKAWVPCTYFRQSCKANFGRLPPAGSPPV